jgi:hypothetical protein
MLREIGATSIINHEMPIGINPSQVTVRNNRGKTMCRARQATVAKKLEYRLTPACRS